MVVLRFVSKGEVAEVDGAFCIVEIACRKVGIDFSGHLRIIPFVSQVNSLRRQVANGSCQLDITRLSFLLDNALGSQLDVGVVNMELAVNVILAVLTVYINMVICIAVVVELMNHSVCLDDSVSAGRKRTAEVNCRCQVSELLVVKQTSQVQLLRVNVTIECPLLVHVEVDGDTAGIRIELVVRLDFRDTSSAGCPP